MKTCRWRERRQVTGKLDASQRRRGITSPPGSADKKSSDGQHLIKAVDF